MSRNSKPRKQHRPRVNAPLLNGIVCNGYRWGASAAEDLGIAMDVAIQITGKAPPAAILAAERHVIALAEMSA